MGRLMSDPVQVVVPFATAVGWSVAQGYSERGDVRTTVTITLAAVDVELVSERGERLTGVSTRAPVAAGAT